MKTQLRAPWGWAALGCGSLLVFAVALTCGALRLSALEVIAALARGVGGGADPTSRIVVDIRLPRVIAAYLVGGALAMSGGALQGVFRNPLADPGVLGVSAGASLGAVITVYTGLASRAAFVLPTAACAGALLAIVALLALAGRTRGYQVGPLLLAGVAIAQVMSALIALLVSLALADFDVGRQVLRWTLGGLDGRTWGHVALALGPTLLAGGVLLGEARGLDVLLLGDVDAVAIGVDPVRVRVRVVLAAAVLTGTAVAVGGPIGFVGLIGPHLVRGVTGASHARLLPACAGAGGAFLLAADAIARTLIAPEEIRLGVVTAVVGAPLFVGMLARRHATETA